jgi:CrcB protein
VTSALADGLMVALGGAIGAPVRYLTDLAVQARHDSLVPWGTVTVNVVGSFLLGAVAALVAHAGLPPAALVLVGTGFCGALTTFSTFGYETVRLLRDGAWLVAGAYVTISLTLGLTACALGWWALPALLSS